MNNDFKLEELTIDNLIALEIIGIITGQGKVEVFSREEFNSAWDKHRYLREQLAETYSHAIKYGKSHLEALRICQEVSGGIQKNAWKQVMP